MWELNIKVFVVNNGNIFMNAFWHYNANVQFACVPRLML